MVFQVQEIVLYPIPHCTSKCVGNLIFSMLWKYDDISHFFQLSSTYPVEVNVTFFAVQVMIRTSKQVALIKDKGM